MPSTSPFNALIRLLRTPAPAPPQPATAQPPPETGLIEALPEPVMVFASEPGREARIQIANAAARSLMPACTPGALLPAAIRHPNLLEIAAAALAPGERGEAAFEPRGREGRSWRAIALPLAATYGSRALLVLSDQTDARRNERMRADFLANASHELRTPLASLLGFIETLRGHARDDPAAREQFLAVMQTQAERMSRLIDDLLSLSRVELSEHLAPAGIIDLALAAGDGMDALAPLAARRGVTFAAVLPPPGRAVFVGDRDQLMQVIQNLLDNAIKYSPQGGLVQVEVQVGPARTAIAARDADAARLSLVMPDDYVSFAILRVSDAGPGLPRDHLPRLTERFYRAPGQKSGERSGTGLGLAIVKHIVNRHRGGLAVESREGAGASFVVYFPLLPSQAPAVTEASPNLGMATAASGTIR